MVVSVVHCRCVNAIVRGDENTNEPHQPPAVRENEQDPDPSHTGVVFLRHDLVALSALVLVELVEHKGEGHKVHYMIHDHIGDAGRENNEKRDVISRERVLRGRTAMANETCISEPISGKATSSHPFSVFG